jgi:hypothetical protein
MPMLPQTSDIGLENQQASAHQRLHKLISYVFEPSLVATPFIFAVVYTRRHTFTLDLQSVYLILSFFGAVVPVLYTITLYKLNKISSIFYSRRADRIYFYPLMIGCEVGVFFFFAYASTSRALISAAFATIVVAVGLAIMTLWNKISYHVAGLGGALSIAVALIGEWGFVLLPVMVLVAYSRTRLREHTWLEVTIGGVYGIVSAALAYRMFSVYGSLFLDLLPGLSR